MKIVWLAKKILLIPVLIIFSYWQPHYLALAEHTNKSIPPEQTYESILQQAETALQAGQYSEAEILLHKAVDKQPDSAEAYYNLGLTLHLQAKNQEAIAAYENAIRINPQYDSPYINLGLAFIEQNQLDKAKTIFHQVLALPERTESPASNHTLAHYNLAVIYKRQGKQEVAIEAIKSALDITPDFPPAQKLLLQLQ